MNNFIYLGTAGLLLAAACGRHAELPTKEVTLQEAYRAERAGDTYRVYVPGGSNHRIFRADSTLAFDWAHPVSETADTVVELTGLGKRTYFAVVSAAGDTAVVSDRKIPFEGPQNFRDIGGLPTADGRHVKWGRFFRSDKLSGLPDDQFDAFNALGIRTVIDLRTDGEATEEPNHLPAGVEQVRMSIFDSKLTDAFSGIETKIRNGELTVAESRQLLVDGNTAFATTFAPKFREVIETAMAAEAPILYHCTAGKDRTGFTTALILSILGVDRETIMAEYLMTNYYTYESNKASLEKANWGSMLKADLDPEVVIPLMTVDRSYLQAAFDAIDNEYGGMDAYLCDQMGITDSLKQVYRMRYTY